MLTSIKLILLVALFFSLVFWFLSLFRKNKKTEVVRTVTIIPPDHNKDLKNKIDKGDEL